MAVGVIVGGAFTAIINALSNNILKPLIDWLLAAIIGGDSLSEIYTVLKPVYDQTTGLLDLTQSIYIDWGAFINAIINFLLIAFVLFCIVKTINRLNDAKDKAKGELLAERAAVKKYRREGLTKAEAMAKYQADLKAAEEEIVKASTQYGTCIHASVEKGNLFACQFHPEKSSGVGLKILQNFVEL